MPHPLVMALIDEIARQRFKIAALEREAGVGARTIRAWRNHHAPLVHNLEAVGNCLGMTLRWVRVPHAERPRITADTAKPPGNGAV